MTNYNERRKAFLAKKREIAPLIKAARREQERIRNRVCKSGPKQKAVFLACRRPGRRPDEQAVADTWRQIRNKKHDGPLILN